MNARRQGQGQAAGRCPVLTVLGPIGPTGNLSVVTPYPLAWLPDWALALIDKAERAHVAGMSAEAVGLALQVETRLGVTDDDRHRAAAANDDIEQALEEAIARTVASWPRPKRMPTFARPQSSGRSKLPRPGPDPARLTRDEQKRLNRLERELIGARTSGDKEKAKAGILEIGAARDARVALADQVAMHAETTALEAGRGAAVVVEEIEVPGFATDENGRRILVNGQAIFQVTKVRRLKISARDGLETLRTAGAIDQVLYTAGLRCRADYEDLDPEKGLTPPDYATDRVMGGGGGENWAQKRQEIQNRIGRLEGAIQQEDASYHGPGAIRPINRVGRAVLTLREVAGKGNTIASLGAGKAQALNTRALALALGYAAIHYGLE